MGWRWVETVPTHVRNNVFKAAKKKLTLDHGKLEQMKSELLHTPLTQESSWALIPAKPSLSM